MSTYLHEDRRPPHGALPLGLRGLPIKWPWCHVTSERLGPVAQEDMCGLEARSWAGPLRTKKPELSLCWKACSVLIVVSGHTLLTPSKMYSLITVFHMNTAHVLTVT